MRQQRKFRRAVSAILTDCKDKASKQNWSQQRLAHLICRKVLEPAMALVGQKESKAQLQVPGLEMASRSRGWAMDGRTAREFRLRDLQRSRLPVTRRSTIWIPPL